MAICIQRKFGIPAEVVSPQVFEAVIDDAEVARRVEKARGFYAEDKGAYTKEKNGLPGFIFSCSGFIPHEYTDTKGVKHPKDTWAHQEYGILNGLFMVDLDHVEDPRQLWQDITAQEVWEKEYKARTFLAGLPNDKSTKNSNRLSFAPCRADVLYYSPELHTYYNKAWADKYTPVYAKGISEPDIFGEDGRRKMEEGRCEEAVKEEGFEDYRYEGLAIPEIIEAWMEGRTLQNKRHETLLLLCRDLKYVCDRKDARVAYFVNQLQWVQDLRTEGDPVDKTIEDGLRYQMNAMMPKRLYAIVRQLQEKKGIRRRESGGSSQETGDGKKESEIYQKFQEYGHELEELAPQFPCMEYVFNETQTPSKPAYIFVAGALFGTLMTRTWYHYFYKPEKERRLNYAIFIVDDPGKGKSFAEDLFEVIMAPIIAADQVGNDSINQFKKEEKRNETASDKNKKDGLVAPDVKIRIHGSRTSNQTFIEDMVNCTDVVGDKLINLHLFTFDSELENANRLSSGTQSWMDKSVFELKAFHNETDNQQYKNKESISGPFKVYWNFVYTGTPVALNKKVTPRNFGNGLFNRLAVLPLCGNRYYVAPLRKQSKSNLEIIDELKRWAFLLDNVKGELPLWPLMEVVHEWYANTMGLAEIEEDEVTAMLCQRVPYYGLHIAAPFIVMRHWEEWNKDQKLKIDETDKKLVSLLIEIQMTCQRYFFGGLCRAYLDNKNAQEQANRIGYNSKSRRLLEALPTEFDWDLIFSKMDNDENKTRVQIWRWCEDKLIKKTGRGKKAKFKKV